MYQQNPALGFSPRQTNASANSSQAQAFASADPRFTAKSFDRAGFSRGQGQYSQGAVQGAEAFATNMGKARDTRLQDAYATANMQLQDQGRQQQFGLALAGLNEDARQTQWNNAQQMAGNLSGLLNGPAEEEQPRSIDEIRATYRTDMLEARARRRLRGR